jgi:hypothetical protein
MRTRAEHGLHDALRASLRRCCGCGKTGQAGLLSGERGSFTLEAAFVAPLLVLASLTLIALALYTAQVAELHRTASATAERSAFDWNQPDAGGGANQGLYWRVGEGIAAWFGLLGGGGDRHVELPVSGAAASTGVTAKLIQAAAKLPAVIRGSISLADRVLFRRLDVRLERPSHLQTMSPLGGLPPNETAGAQSTVVDPVELIRLVDLTRSYTPAVRARLTPAQARSALIEPEREDGGAVRIRSEREASEYLRKVTGGQQRIYPLEQGKSRVVDALDSGGIAHQAFYTYTEPQLLQDQMPKDAKLLQDGTVQGVVWHFFLSDRAAEPSAALRAQLERRGIAVVVHR